jgi:hypothetical protein
MNIQLIDDGTLDTVININGETFRYSYQNSEVEDYEEFITWAENDALEQYEELSFFKGGIQWKHL